MFEPLGSRVSQGSPPDRPSSGGRLDMSDAEGGDLAGSGAPRGKGGGGRMKEGSVVGRRLSIVIRSSVSFVGRRSIVSRFSFADVVASERAGE
eukprot:8425150-Pyramimonas_sp.AAC.1